MPKICLGIESSCDETALALVQGGRFLAQTLASQADLHALFGGVVPELASREHLRFIGVLFDELMQKAQIAPSQIDIIAVARGPGLLGSLLVGTAFAKGLALALQKPLIGVNHLHAHLLANCLEEHDFWPAIGLVISGGHTDLYKVNSPSWIERIGRTLDDAVGECFDKVGAVLGLSYPAGKTIDALASSVTSSLGTLPRPYLHNDNLNFSFSGLKTAAINFIRQHKLSVQAPDVGAFCRELNEAVADALETKVARALTLYPHISTLCVAGGVAANTLIRTRLAAFMAARGGKFLAPAPCFCTDNAAMVALAGSYLDGAGLCHDLHLEAIPRGRSVPADWQWNFLKI